MGSLCAANPSASRAVASSIPAISNRMRPGFTTATHLSGAPLPLPMRVSAGFLVKGLSGKMRIHNLPPRLMNRVMATREASIWRSVIQAFSKAFKPYSPNDNSPPRQALPLRRPRICFLYFTFFGINIVLFSLPLHAWARPRQVQQSRPCSLRLRHRCSFAFVLNLRSTLRNVFALVDPALHADYPVCCVGLRETEIDVRALDVNRADASALQLFLQLFAQFHVFVQQVGIFLVGIPAGLPRFVVAEPESVRMSFLSHSVSLTRP